MSHTEQMREALLDDLAKWEAHVRRYDVDGACNPLANTLQQARAALTAPAAEVPEAMGDAEINSLRYLLDVDDYDPKMMKFASAILRHRDAQWQSTRLRGGVPEGWKLVPVEPTPEMVAAGMEALFNRGPVKKPWDDYVAEMFAAILGAAPQSPALGSGVSTVKAEFNGAIDFAIREGIGAAIFLEAWRHGDTSEWPEFAAMSAQAGKGGAA